MAVTEKRINRIEQTLVRQDEQIARVFSDITDIRDSQQDMLKMFAQFKGILIGGVVIFIALQVGLLEAFKIVLAYSISRSEYSIGPISSKFFCKIAAPVLFTRIS